MNLLMHKSTESMKCRLCGYSATSLCDFVEHHLDELRRARFD